MGIENARNGKLLYHLTKAENIDSIMNYGLLPRKVILENSIAFGDVADREIISKRTELGLDGYTPFHFHPYSAFDAAVKHSFNPQNMLYICIDRELARLNHFKILPRHPLSELEVELYEYDEGYSMIDWDTMEEKGRTDNEAREVKMAECLTDLIVPPSCFKCIYVPNQEVKDIVEAAMEKHDVTFSPPYVNVQKVWFNAD
ncbi:DarT ssDNA thymidine ADP-ribosyltransferase family protein [Lachnospiraceae bacterium LCP25S3_G4]